MQTGRAPNITMKKLLTLLFLSTTFCLGQVPVLKTSTNIVNGILNFQSPSSTVFLPMGGSVIDLTKAGMIFSASGNIVFTYSNSSPLDPTTVILRLVAVGADRTFTFPTGTIDLSTGASISPVTVTSGTTKQYRIQYIGGVFEAFNVVGGGGGGGGSPGGSNTQVQFNDGGSFGGDAGMTYNKTTDALTVAGSVTTAALTTTGVNSFTGNDLTVYTAMPALAVDVTKAGNSYSATGSVVFTYSNSTPAAGSSTLLRITADSGGPYTITIPTTWSLARGGNITTLAVPASTVLQVRLQYLSSRWEIIGDPVATTGTGSYALSDSPVFTTKIQTPTIELGNATDTTLARTAAGQLSVEGNNVFTATKTKTDAVQAAQVVTLTSSSTDTYAGTAAVTITGYVTGVHYTFSANTANTGVASINIDGQGAKTIVKVVGGVSTTLSDNDIRSGQIVDLVYDGTNMQIQSTLGNGWSSTSTNVQTQTGLAVTTVSGYTLTNTTAAGAGAPQYSPAYIATGTGWDTDNLVSKSISFRWFCKSDQGFDNPVGNWTLQSSQNGGAWVDCFMVGNAGLVQAISWIASGGAGIVQCGSSGYFSVGANSHIKSGTDGQLTVSNNAETDFSRLNFGGTTSSFPAIKRSTTTLAVRLADDSADAAITASTGSFSDNISTTAIGKTLLIKSGTNAKSGTFTLSSGAATVANTSVTANSCIGGITIKTASGSATSLPRVATTTPGTGFTVAGTATDNGTYNYFIIEVN